MSKSGGKKIALICCYFGSWPSWMRFFCDSVASNPKFNLFLFTDCGPLPKDCSAPNISVFPFTFQQLITSVEEELGFKTGISTLRQVCNIKPLYGSVFKEHLRDFDFWAQIDIDLIYGNISAYITDGDFENYDVISVNHSIASGHFCLFRNEERINRLYKELPYLKEYLWSEGFSLDECVLGGHIHSHRFLKSIRFRFKEVIYDDHLFRLRGREKFAVVVDRKANRVFDPLMGKDFMYFHFQEAKKTGHFRTSFPEKTYPYYLLTNEGIEKLNFIGHYWFKTGLWLTLFTDAKWLFKYRLKRILGIEPFRYE